MAQVDNYSSWPFAWIQDRSLNSERRLTFVLLAGGRNGDSSDGVPGDGVVAHGVNPEHLRHGPSAKEQPMDMPDGSGLLRRVGHMGPCWAQEDIWEPRRVWKREPVLRRRCGGAAARLARPQGLPGEEMDKADKHAGADRRHGNDATGLGRELHDLDNRWIHLRLRCLQAPARLVEAVQLRALRRP